MAISVGPKGHITMVSSASGPKRKVKVVSFIGRSTAGAVNHPQIDSNMQPIAVIDMVDGSLRTAEFSDTGNTMGTLTQIDTGPSGHACWAIFTDTGI